MEVESHIGLLYKQRPYEHCAHSKHHCVLPSLMFLLSSARSYPFFTSKYNKLFWADILSIRPSWWNIFQMFLLFCVFLSPQDWTHTLFPPMFPNTYHWIINLCPQALFILLPLHPSPFIYYCIYLIHSFLLDKNWQEILLSLSTLRGNPSFFPILFSHLSFSIVNALK